MRDVKLIIEYSKNKNNFDKFINKEYSKKDFQL